MKKSGECVFELEKFLYAAEEGESLFSIQQKFGVPIAKLVEDNRLDGEPLPGQYLFIDETLGETEFVLPDGEFDLQSAKVKNNVPIFYPFQLIYK